MEYAERLQQMIDESENIVFFGGAGVSTESGIPDFRSVDGLYHTQYRFPPETILSHDFFLSHTQEFFAFYKAKMLQLGARPNMAHKKLAELEKEGKLKAVVTQNIDGLHQAAGSTNVLELHGSVHRNTCMDCGKRYTAEDILRSGEVPYCTCGGIIKPDIVLYGEMLSDDVMNRSVKAIAAADMLIVGGTSLVVYPAAGLIEYYGGNKLVLINKAPTGRDGRADLLIPEKIGEVLSKIK